MGRVTLQYTPSGGEETFHSEIDRHVEWGRLFVVFFFPQRTAALALEGAVALRAAVARGLVGRMSRHITGVSCFGAVVVALRNEARRKQ